MRLYLVAVLIFLAIIPSVAQYKLYQEGTEKYNQKDYYGAIESFSDFLTKPYREKKFDADAYYWRGLASFRLNDFTVATEDLRQALTLGHPNKGNIHWFLAKSLDTLKQYNESLDEYAKALSILGKDKQKEFQILADRSKVHVKMGNTTAALDDLHTASNAQPGNDELRQRITELEEPKTRNAGNATGKETTKTGEDKKVVVKTPETKTQTQPDVEKKVLDDQKAGDDKKLAANPTETKTQSQPDAEKKVIESETKGKQPEETRKVADNTPVTQPGTDKMQDDKKKEVALVTVPEVKKSDERKVEPNPVTQPQVVEPKEPTLAELYGDEKRYALVIGNSAYSKEIGVLKNPANDATDFAEVLKKMNFEVTLITDASYGKIRAEMMKFRDKLNQGERDKTVGLFYYAGHGLQHDNENYVVPVDAEIQYEDDIARFCFPIQKMVLAQMEMSNSRMNIVILDACRNNPFPAIHRGIGESQGLGEMKKARGAFIAYATSPGSVASDGSGRNGLYTQELIKAMNKPGKTIEQVFKEVRANVLRQSGDKQNPWENSNIIGDFYFKFD